MLELRNRLNLSSGDARPPVPCRSSCLGTLDRDVEHSSTPWRSSGSFHHRPPPLGVGRVPELIPAGRTATPKARSRADLNASLHRIGAGRPRELASELSGLGQSGIRGLIDGSEAAFERPSRLLGRIRGGVPGRF